jgi:hypothetical protein
MKAVRTYRFKHPGDAGRYVEMIACSPISAVVRINRIYKRLDKKDNNSKALRVKVSDLIPTVKQ